MYKSFSKALIAAAVLSGVSVSANAVSIIDNTSVGYYNAGLGTLLDTTGVNDPFPCANVACGDATVSYATAPNLSAASAQLGTWLTGSAPTGGAWSASPIAISSTWAINTETAIVYAINAGAGLTGVNLSLGVDNGVFVWLNGTYVFGARAGGGSTLGEYSFALANLTGTNYLQVLREDHGGATGYDISLTATRVPEPATIAVFGLGLLGLAFVTRKRALKKFE